MSSSWHHDNRTTTERGYGYQWQKLRLTILERDGHVCQCEDCKKAGTIKVATHVDHITSKAKAQRLGWTKEQIDHPDNLQAINKDCHDKKSIEETGKKYTHGGDETGHPKDPDHHWN